jgi:hypothetical protein
MRQLRHRQRTASSLQCKRRLSQAPRTYLCDRIPTIACDPRLGSPPFNLHTTTQLDSADAATHSVYHVTQWVRPRAVLLQREHHAPARLCRYRAHTATSSAQNRTKQRQTTSYEAATFLGSPQIHCHTNEPQHGAQEHFLTALFHHSCTELAQRTVTIVHIVYVSARSRSLHGASSSTVPSALTRPVLHANCSSTRLMIHLSGTPIHNDNVLLIHTTSPTVTLLRRPPAHTIGAKITDIRRSAAKSASRRPQARIWGRGAPYWNVERSRSKNQKRISWARSARAIPDKQILQQKQTNKTTP